MNGEISSSKIINFLRNSSDYLIGLRGWIKVLKSVEIDLWDDFYHSSSIWLILLDSVIIIPVLYDVKAKIKMQIYTF